jgi:hypothetical protein
MLNKKEGMMDCFEIYGEEDLASLLSGQWGIKEPETSWNGTPRTHGETIALHLCSHCHSAELIVLAALQNDNELLDLILLPGGSFLVRDCPRNDDIDHSLTRLIQRSRTTALSPD